MYTYTILCVLFFILLKAEMQGTQYVWQQRKMNRKLKDKAFENYSAKAEERMWRENFIKRKKKDRTQILKHIEKQKKNKNKKKATAVVATNGE